MYKGKRLLGSFLSGVLIFSLAFGGAPASSSSAAAKKATIKTKKISVQAGKSKTISLKNKKKNCKYTFKSSKKGVATVSSKGKVKGIKAGSAKITVKEIAKKGKGKKRTLGTVKVTVTKKKINVTAKPSNSPSNKPAATPTQKPADNNNNPTAAPTTEPTAPAEPTATTPTKKGDASVKVYVDEVKDENLVGEVEGPGTVPTAVPTEDPDAVVTPAPTPQVIVDNDFESGDVTPFEKRGNGTPAICTDFEGADGTSKCMSVTGRTSNWNGTAINMKSFAQAGQKYEVTCWLKQITGADLKISTTLQVTPTGGDVTYKNQNNATVPTDEWTKVTFTTEEIPDYAGDLLLYFETGGTEDFYIDEFTLSGVVKDENEFADLPDISAGLNKDKFGNPSITSRLTADPYVIEYDGRVYVYGTNDSQQYAEAPDKANNYAKINTLNCYSSADMVNWTDHGEIQVAGATGAAKWANNSWAPAVCHKKIDGKEKFFLYFANNASSIGVLTSDSPTGPWTDPTVSLANPKGKALIDRSVEGCAAEDVEWLFDPAVLVDDDGQGYLYFGGIGSSKTDLDHLDFVKNPKCSRVVKLGDDMVSTVGKAETIDAPYMFEDSGINKIGDKYYYSYCTNWTGFDGRDPKCPAATIAVMESSNPMSGFTYVGSVLKNPGNYFGATGNNHHVFIEFKGEYYAFYHTKNDSLGLGLPEDYRTTYVNKLNLGDNGNFTNADGSIADTKMTKTGVDAISAVDPFATQEAETYGISKDAATVACENESTVALWNAANRAVFNKGVGSYIGVGEVDFGTDGASSITMNMADATADKAEYKNYKADFSKKVTGKHTVYFVFEKADILVDNWKCTK